MVSATFDVLSLEAHALCRYDSVTLFDGRDAKSNEIGKYCIVIPQQPVLSTDVSLLVVFKSDRYVNTGRFALTWTFVRQTDPGWHYNITIHRNWHWLMDITHIFIHRSR